MSTTLREIRIALLGALRGLLVSAPTPGPFQTVQSFAGQIRSPASIDLTSLGQIPAAILGFERERYDVTVLEQTTLLLGRTAVGAESFWQVFVVCTDLRTAQEISEDPSPTGIDACVQAVLGTLASARIPGAVHEQVELVETLPLVNRPGEFIHVVRVRVVRALDADTRPEPSVPLERVDGQIGESDTFAPLAEIRAHTR